MSARLRKQAEAMQAKWVGMAPERDPKPAEPEPALTPRQVALQAAIRRERNKPAAAQGESK